MNRNRFAPFREITNIFGVVECLDVFTRTGNSHAIQQFKEIEVERIEDCSGSSLVGRQTGPPIERALGAAEDFINSLLRIQSGI
jgi:hypothetical protein